MGSQKLMRGFESLKSLIYIYARPTPTFFSWGVGIRGYHQKSLLISSRGEKIFLFAANVPYSL